MRRRFFLFAAPAIVAAPSLMRVSSAVFDGLLPVEQELRYSGGLSELITETLRRRSDLLAETVRKNNAILRHLSNNNLVGSFGATTYYGRPGATLWDGKLPEVTKG